MKKASSLYSIPNLLCFFRMAVIPAMIVLFFIDSKIDSRAATWANVILFALAGVSDFLDGYIARATGQTSLLGKFLDSSTDKLLVGSTLLLLAAFDRMEGWLLVLGIVVLLREILISGVREFMALYNVIVPVSLMAKWKFTLQMLAMGFLVGAGPNALIPQAHAVGAALFVVATYMTVASGWQYLRAALTTVYKIDSGQQAEGHNSETL